MIGKWWDRMMWKITAGRSEKASATAEVLVTGGMKTQWSPDRYDIYAKEVYMHNLIGFKSIDEVAKAVSSVEWQLFRVNKDGEKEQMFDHPLNQLLQRPQPYMGFSQLLARNTAFLVLNGNSYIEGVTLQTGPRAGVPMELYSLRPDRVTIEVDPNTGLLEEYVYRNMGKKIFFPIDRVTQRSAILHIKLFHPLNDFYGMGPTRPASREIDTSNAATNWQKALLDNMGRPGMIFTFENNLTDTQKKEMHRVLDDRFSGSANAGKNLLLEGSGLKDVKPYGFTPVEMDFIDSHRELARKIAFGYGVPPQLIGIPGDNTFSNYKEARAAFWENTVFFYLQLYQTEFNNWFFGADNPESLLLTFDKDSTPAMAEKREKVWERAQESNFLTVNEKREMVGFEKIEEGDVILVPGTMVPLGEEIDDDEGNNDDDDDDNGNDDNEGDDE